MNGRVTERGVMRKAGTRSIEQDSFIKSFWVWCGNEAHKKPRDVCAGPVKGGSLHEFSEILGFPKF